MITKKNPKKEGRSLLAFPFQRRERRYLDFKIQHKMMWALVFMEVTLVLAGVIYLYYRFQLIILENFYRIHQLPRSVRSIFMEETGEVILFLLAINVLVLLLADRGWVWYIKSVLSSFGLMADKMADLNMQSDERVAARHETLDMMVTWRRGERERAIRIRELISKLESPESMADATARERMRHALQELRRTLPPYSRRFIGRLE